MKVKELIAKLQEFDEELEVKIFDYNSYKAAQLEKATQENSTIYLECGI
ncbi:MAG: hypothetical protein WCJ58_00885 [bacterium]